MSEEVHGGDRVEDVEQLAAQLLGPDGLLTQLPAVTARRRTRPTGAADAIPQDVLLDLTRRRLRQRAVKDCAVALVQCSPF